MMTTIAEMIFRFEAVPDAGAALVKFEFETQMKGTWRCLEGDVAVISRLDSGLFEKRWQGQRGYFDWRLTDGQGALVLDMLEAPEGPSDPYHTFGRFNPRIGEQGVWKVAP